MTLVGLTWSLRDWILDCLVALAELDYLVGRLQTVVVGTSQAIRERGLSAAALENGENLGFVESNNVCLL